MADFLLRGDTTPVSGTKLGVIDLGTAGTPRADFTIPELDGTSPGAFKFSTDGNRFYILAGNATTATKNDVLFAFYSSTLTATPWRWRSCGKSPLSDRHPGHGCSRARGQAKPNMSPCPIARMIPFPLSTRQITK
ncbi:MAG: hypothetical protein ABI988_09425 [Nitrospirota bacterium]